LHDLLDVRGPALQVVEHRLQLSLLAELLLKQADILLQQLLLLLQVLLMLDLLLLQVCLMQVLHALPFILHALLDGVTYLVLAFKQHVLRLTVLLFHALLVLVVLLLERVGATLPVGFQLPISLSHRQVVLVQLLLLLVLRKHGTSRSADHSLGRVIDVDLAAAYVRRADQLLLSPVRILLALREGLTTHAWLRWTPCILVEVASSAAVRHSVEVAHRVLVAFSDSSGRPISCKAHALGIDASSVVVGLLGVENGASSISG